MQSVALRPREARRKSPPAPRTLVLNADYRPLSTYPLSIIAAQRQQRARVRKLSRSETMKRGFVTCFFVRARKSRRC